jgi:hypothetical protein
MKSGEQLFDLFVTINQPETRLKNLSLSTLANFMGAKMF